MTIPELATILAQRHHARYHDEPWADLSAREQVMRSVAVEYILGDLYEVQKAARPIGPDGFTNLAGGVA